MYFSCQIEDAEGVVSENGKNNTLSQWNLWNGWTVFEHMATDDTTACCPLPEKSEVPA
jgi:hypothetical protein